MDEVDIIDKELPLIIRPKNGESSVSFLLEWISKNKSLLDEKLIKHGAILFRGFDVKEAMHFQKAVQQFQPDLSTEYRGTSPRKAIQGTDFVFTASELPSFMPIPQHCEMSFLRHPPAYIFFCCLEAPTSFGGETTLCDFKKVYDELNPNIRQEFEEKKITYVRNYNGKKTLFTDPTMLKGWQDVFDTKDKSIVEQECRKNFLDYQWKRNDGLRVVNIETAVEKHPVTGEKVWYNHLTVFHWSMVPNELRRIYKRNGWIRFLILWLLATVAKIFFLKIFGPMNVGFHTMFGNGQEIPEAYQEHVRDVVWKNMVFNRWRKGDIVMIDNFRVSHGRQPYSGKRKIVVAWSKPAIKSSQVMNT